jgi:hypothetical protein
MLVKSLNGFCRGRKIKSCPLELRQDYKIDKSLYSDLLCNSPRINSDSFLRVFNGRVP